MISIFLNRLNFIGVFVWPLLETAPWELEKNVVFSGIILNTWLSCNWSVHYLSSVYTGATSHFRLHSPPFSSEACISCLGLYWQQHATYIFQILTSSPWVSPGARVQKADIQIWHTDGARDASFLCFSPSGSPKDCPMLLKSGRWLSISILSLSHGNCGLVCCIWRHLSSLVSVITLQLVCF